MIKFEISAALVKSAMLFQAKNDVRYYLCGVRIEPGRIMATNGHYVFIHDFPEPISIMEPITIFVKGVIPVRARTLKFELSEDRGVAYCEDGIGRVLSAIYFEIVGGNYPDIDKVIPTDDLAPTDIIAVNSDYLVAINKAAKLCGIPSFPAVTLNLRGHNRGIVFDINGPEFKSKVILMPVRLYELTNNS